MKYREVGSEALSTFFKGGKDAARGWQSFRRLVDGFKRAVATGDRSGLDSEVAMWKLGNTATSDVLVENK